MSKWYGKIGYAQTTEKQSGVWSEDFIEKSYYGEVTRNSRKLQSSSGVNDDVVISNEISIISDPYSINNFHTIRYVEYMGVKWKVVSVEIKSPRLFLSIGGVYNG
ncbi:MAG: hypothetical protein R3Y12_05405 [Clostridia bacterium]